MSDTVIRVENLGKRYRLGQYEKEDTFAGQLKNTLLYPIKNFRRITSLNKFKEDGNDPSIFWSLKDINFEVKQGEVLGIIGKNGAGKSTLLKLLSKITEPTTGRIEMKGRVSALLEVGTGFHPELTGRDNVYMNGTILGMTKWEIDAKFEEIVEFAGVSKHIDTPVKFYSTGMKVRLGFSVAAHLEPEILIIDEVLSVGDYEFQKKCLGKMDEVADSGRTVLFVSHNMTSVQNLCKELLVLKNGIKVFKGNTVKGIDYYLSGKERILSFDQYINNENAEGKGIISFDSFSFEDDNGKERKNIFSGDKINFRINFKCKKDIHLSLIRIQIFSSENQMLCTLNSHHSVGLFKKLPKSGYFLCRFPNLPFLDGEYYFTILCSTRGEGQFYKLEPAGRFVVHEGDYFNTGIIPQDKKGLLVSHSWELKMS